MVGSRGGAVGDAAGGGGAAAAAATAAASALARARRTRGRRRGPGRPELSGCRLEVVVKGVVGVGGGGGDGVVGGGGGAGAVARARPLQLAPPRLHDAVEFALARLLRDVRRARVLLVALPLALRYNAHVVLVAVRVLANSTCFALRQPARVLLLPRPQLARRARRPRRRARRACGRARGRSSLRAASPAARRRSRARAWARGCGSTRPSCLGAQREIVVGELAPGSPPSLSAPGRVSSISITA